MNRESYSDAKRTFKEISELLKEGNLTEEEKQRLETLHAQLAGALLHPWLPLDWGRRSIMIALFLFGLYGLIEGQNHFLWAWLVLLIFSPRFVGELSNFFGKISR